VSKFPAKPAIDPRRRQILQLGSAVAGLALAGGVARAAEAAEAAEAADDPWQKAQAIIDSFSQPLVFRDEDFPITNFGAEPCALVPATAWVSFVDEAAVHTPKPGATDCHPAIKAAIAACHAAGGGRVVIPAGNWFCAGPIVLLSQVHVHLKAGAHVYFSNRPADYARHGDIDCGPRGRLTITRWEGNDLISYSPLIYAYGQTNIALTGEDWTSILDGQGGLQFDDSPDCWWSWKGREQHTEGPADRHVPNSGRTEVHVNPLNPRSLREAAPQLSAAEAGFIQGPGEKWRRDSDFLRALGEARVPLEQRIFGLGHYLRPHMIQFISCTDVLFQGYQVTNTPFWQHNPVHCRNVHVKGVFANSMGPNNDGFDPEACDNVLIEDSQFNTGDDCIAIDAGKGLDTQFGPAQNIVIQNCRMQSGHGALTLGSIMSGGIQNVYAQNLVFENSHWKTDPLNVAIRLKCSMNRGGFLRNVHVRNISVPNGVRTTPGMYSSLPGSLIPDKAVSVNAGAIIAIDCGYDAILDNVRTRPPVVSNVHISNVVAGNVDAAGGRHSSYQAIVVLGPIATDYNGPKPMPEIRPVTDVTISDCDLGMPVKAQQPIYLFNVQGLKLKNVRIGGELHNETLSAPGGR
jgi:polygalacturonase